MEKTNYQQADVINVAGALYHYVFACMLGIILSVGLTVTPCLPHDFTDEEVEELLDELEHAEKIISDDESKTFVRQIVEEP